MIQTDGTSIFEERAEHLPREALARWTTLSTRETLAVSKLKGGGAKLLIGPRGSGKSTLMRVAYYELLDGDDALPVYVNYARHLALEPMFHSRPDATELFRQWVLSKMIVGCVEALHEADLVAAPDAEPMLGNARSVIQDLEVGRFDYSERPMVSPTDLISFLVSRAHDAHRKRVVLLLDDAAHAFSAQQQREFFEIFRQLKSRVVAPKAAVYPGVTNYSSNMHIGHDAELVEVWYRADDSEFLSTMREVLNRRLPSELLQLFDADRQEYLNYLALASFGLPRSFLTMIQDMLEFDEDSNHYVPPTRKRADAAIARNAENVRQVFASTGTKIPRYANLIAQGQELEHALLAALRAYNATREPGSKTITVGFRQPMARQFQQVIDLMSYAGILRRLDTLSRGSAGIFERYEVHAGVVIDANALSLGRSPSTRDVIASLTQRPTAGLVRTRAESLLGSDYLSRCTLNLTPCTNCGAARASEDAQYCMRCGKPLTEKSVYAEILRRPVSDLPIPLKKKQALEQTQLRTIQDVLLDQEFRELLRGRRIGPVWAKRILSTAEEFVSV